MVATKPISVKEFEAMPLEGAWELVDGEMVEVTPSANRSGWVSGRVFSRLEQFVDSQKTGWAFPAETGFVLFNDRATVRSPDAAYVRRDRLPELTDHFVPVPPDLAVEVLSPSDRLADALAKVAMYLQAGVELVWLVDPAARTVTLFQPGDSIAVLHDSDMLDGGTVLPGFAVSVAAIFSGE